MYVLSIIIAVMVVFSGVIGLNDAFAQTEINVTEAQPCFLNYTAGVQMWKNCGFQEDYLGAVLAPFEWVTGGLFSMIIVAVLIIMTYIKYHTIIYPIIIGVVMFPVSFFLFPENFLSFGILLAFVGIGALIWYIIVRQTKEY